MPAKLSEFDKAHMQEILLGAGDWFSAELLRLIAKADTENRARLYLAFPDHVEAYNTWVKEGYEGE